MKAIFFGPNGLRAGWRFTIFLGIVFVEFALAGAILRLAFPHELARARRPTTLNPSSSLFEAAIFVVTVIAAFVMSKIEKRKFGTYGLPLRPGVGKLFWRGAGWGFVAISAVLFAIFAFGGFRVHGLATHGVQLLEAFLAWCGAFLVVGLSEEFAFRGYPQFTLASGIGFWPAAVLLSLGFAAAHLGNAGESPLGILEVVLFGVVFCLVLLRTGNLWWGIGFHASWDWGETFFYGVRDSGLAPWHPLLATSFSGPAWLTGGSTGPEASVMTCVALAVTAICVARAYPRAAYSTGTVSTT